MKNRRCMRIISLILACGLCLSLVPVLDMPVVAADNSHLSYNTRSGNVIGNGVAIPNGNIPADGSNQYCSCSYAVGTGFGYHWCCWNYGYYVYYYAWGVEPNRYDNSTHYLRNLSASEKTFNASNLKKFLSNAAPGALVRIDALADPATGDNNGHTLVFVKMNSTGDGAYFLEGNYDGLGRSALSEWKFDNLVAQYGPGSYYNYQYIKYISWPNAPAYTSESAPVCAYDVATGGVNSVYVRGWAYDPDTPNESVNIHVYMDGTYIGSGVANTLREDVNAVYGCGSNHGFDITIPVTVAETGNHSIDVYALNTNTSGENKHLGSKEVTITAHTHSYSSSVTKEATCTESGTKTYSCEICEDTYTEEIPAMGHKYIAEVIDATCTTVGHTAYTCERCEDRYTEMSDGWSGWSTEYPSGIPENLIQQKEQYSTLEKEYTTSTSESLDGWTNYGTTYGDWGTTQTTTTKPTESDILQITNTVQTGWGYYHWCSYYDWTYCIDSIQVNGATQVEWHGYTSSFELPAYTIPDMGGQQSYGGDGNGAAACSRNFYIWFRNYDADVYTYSYQTREKNYQFCRWADEWSDWVDEEVTSNEDRQVKTQTVYRYYIGDLADHNYSYAVTQAPTTTESGVLTGTCTECSDITTNTLPILNTTDYTYNEIKAPSYSETGIGRYTWKTNEYGSFSFDVELEKMVDINAPQIIVNGSKARPGGTVAVRISLKNNPGIASMRLKVNYDSSVMSLVEVTDLGMIGSQIHSDQYTDPYVLCWANDTISENFTSNGDVVILKFSISDSTAIGSYDISVSYDYDRYDIHNVQVEKVKFYAINDTVEVVDVLPGDANGDGFVDTLDRLTLSRYLANWKGYTLDQLNFAGADVNSDGSVDTLDRLILSRHLANWSGYGDITNPPT